MEETKQVPRRPYDHEKTTELVCFESGKRVRKRRWTFQRRREGDHRRSRTGFRYEFMVESPRKGLSTQR